MVERGRERSSVMHLYITNHITSLQLIYLQYKRLAAHMRTGSEK